LKEIAKHNIWIYGLSLVRRVPFWISFRQGNK